MASKSRTSVDTVRGARRTVKVFVQIFAGASLIFALVLLPKLHGRWIADREWAQTLASLRVGENAKAAEIARRA